MSKTVKEIANIPLSDTKSGKIEIATLTQPYGEGSSPVASIGIFMNGNGDEPDWKVHIPKDNIESVIAALEEAKAAL